MDTIQKREPCKKGHLDALDQSYHELWHFFLNHWENEIEMFIFTVCIDQDGHCRDSGGYDVTVLKVIRVVIVV